MLMLTLNITLKEAQLGFSRTITSLDNRQIKVSRTGTSQPGDQIRVAGEGFPIKNYGTNGDLIVTLQIHLPKKQDKAKADMWRNYFSVAGSSY